MLFVWGLGIRMLTHSSWHETSVYDGIGLQVPMVLDHDYIPHTHHMKSSFRFSVLLDWTTLILESVNKGDPTMTHHRLRTSSFSHSSPHRGSGRVYNVTVCDIGSDWMLWRWQHILLSNSWTSSCDQTLLPCFHTTFRRIGLTSKLNPKQGTPVSSDDTRLYCNEKQGVNHYVLNVGCTVTSEINIRRVGVISETVKVQTKTATVPLYPATWSVFGLCPRSCPSFFAHSHGPVWGHSVSLLSQETPPFFACPSVVPPCILNCFLLGSWTFPAYSKKKNLKGFPQSIKKIFKIHQKNGKKIENTKIKNDKMFYTNLYLIST